MAVGSGSNQYDGYDKFYLKIVGLKKGEEKVEFEVSKKVGEKYEVVGRERQVSGQITDITTRTFTYNGDEIPKLIIYMVDPNASESIRIETGYNQLSRSLINALADKDLNGVEVMFRVYNEKKEGRPRIHVEIDNERADWAIPMEDLQSYIDVNEIYKGGKKTGEEVDFERLNKLMFGEVLDSIKERVTKQVPPPAGRKDKPYGEHHEEQPEEQTETRKKKSAYPTAEEVKAEADRQDEAARAAERKEWSAQKPSFLRKKEEQAPVSTPAAAPAKPSFLKKPAAPAPSPDDYGDEDPKKDLPF